MFVIFSVFYILVAAAMIVLILIQRGEGASAGASFGGGSSGTVFGARGSASFLSRATYGLVTLFFLLSLGMAIYLSHSGAPKPGSDLGVMSGLGTTTSAPTQGNQTGSQTGNQATPKAANPAAARSANSASAVPKATVPAAAGSGKAKPAVKPDSDVPSATVGGKQGKQGASDKDQKGAGPDKIKH
jgi:preprotein translocase subunit SecG